MKAAIHLLVIFFMVYSSLHQARAVSSTNYCNCSCLQELTNGWTLCQNLSGHIEELSYIKSVLGPRVIRLLKLTDQEDRLNPDAAHRRTLNMIIGHLEERRLEKKAGSDLQDDLNGDARLMEDDDLDVNESNNTFSVKTRRAIVEESNNPTLESIIKLWLGEHLQKYLDEHLSVLRERLLNTSLLHFMELTQARLTDLKRSATQEKDKLTVLEKSVAKIRKEIKNIRRTAVKASQPGGRCPKGDRGVPGSDGVSAPPGVKGERGVKGDTGVPGSDGVPAPPGVKGERGVKGDTGVPGSGGVPAPPGVQGETGMKGEKGSPGYGMPEIKGPKGYPDDIRGLEGFPGMKIFPFPKGDMRFTDLSRFPGLKGEPSLPGRVSLP